MSSRRLRPLLLILGMAGAMHASVITLEDTIPTGNLFLQPPVLTGAASLFGGGGLVLADAFTAPASASLYQITVATDYVFLPPLGVTGTSWMLLTLLSDTGDSPGAAIESWVVPMSPTDTNLTLFTVTSVTNALLTAGQQYWLSEVPTDPSTTGIGWGLASPGYPGIQLPIASSDTGVNSGWGPTAFNIANEFSVTGNTPAAVPEPATLGVSALALLIMIAGLRAFSHTASRKTFAAERVTYRS